jgi:protein-tyrosine phosphatase
VIRIAMVCLGNICRSPMAAAVASALVEEKGLSGQVEIESFGTAGYHIGEAADRQAAAALARRGWPSTGHRARRITPEDVERVDLILCADQANREAVRRLAPSAADSGKIRLLRTYDPEGGADAEVPDPWGLSDADFDGVLDIVERSCRGLVSELAARSS